MRIRKGLFTRWVVQFGALIACYFCMVVGAKLHHPALGTIVGFASLILVLFFWYRGPKPSSASHKLPSSAQRSQLFPMEPTSGGFGPSGAHVSSVETIAMPKGPQDQTHKAVPASGRK
jgi:hypothetical protein